MATLTQELTKGYYHCLECGALFEADLKDPKDQRCLVCGHPPTGKILVGNEEETLVSSSSEPKEKSSSELLPRSSAKLHGVNHDTQEIYEATMATLEAQKESRNGRVRRIKRKGKKSGGRVFFVMGWLVLMVGVIVLFEIFGPKEESDSEAQNTDIVSEQREAVALEQKKKRMIDAALPDCERSMMGFLSATSAASKAQHVYQGVKLSGVMNRYYRDRLSFSTSSSHVKIITAELLDGFEVSAIGALCMNSEGKRWEAIFLLTGDGWKIDWASLVRYDDRSWSLFPAGKDGDEGEFRLYMRVRDTNEDFEQKEMSLVFYKPEMFFKDEYRGVASDPVAVSIGSDLGRSISALLDQEDAVEKVVRRDAFGLRVGLIDPSRYHRVRVKMRLHKEGENDKDSRMELLDILANHWYGLETKVGAPEEDVEASP